MNKLNYVNKEKKIKVELDDRYFGTKKIEVNEPLIEHPCIHRLGAWRGY
jgi:hypothetical protein